MFIRLLVAASYVVILVQSVATNSSKGQPAAAALTLPKQATLYDDYDLTDAKTLSTNIEGSGGAASLDEYADDEDEEQLSKVTANSTSTTTTARTTVFITTRTATTTTMLTTRRTTTTTETTTTTMSTTPVFSTTIRTAPPTRSTVSTTFVNKWSRTTSNHDPPRKKNPGSTTSTTASNDLDGGEFKDEHEDYADDLEDDAYYNEPTVSNKASTTFVTSSRYPAFTTRPPPFGNHTTPLWLLFGFLTRPPIAAGILAGLAIGIFTSIILLICIIRRYHKRDKSHSSYTTGLLYPNQYGYSKSPQEFYA